MAEKSKAGLMIDKLRSTKEKTVILIVFVLFILMSISDPVFLSTENMKTTFVSMACDGIIGVGMIIALISGGFDLSVGAIMGLTAMMTAVFSVQLGWNIWLAAIVALLLGTAVGFVNGLLIGKIGLNAFITTLGMMSIARGIIYILSEGSAISISSVDKSFRVLGSGTIGEFPIIIIIFLVIAVIGEIFIRKSAIVMKVFYVGSNEKAAMLSGINVSRVKTGVYTFTGLMSAVAGILAVSRFGVATVSLGSGVEMNVISAGVIGGASLAGGEGSVVGTTFGIFLLAIINNALVLFNVSVHWQSLISGIILILAVTFDLMSHKKKYKKIA